MGSWSRTPGDLTGVTMATSSSLEDTTTVISTTTAAILDWRLLTKLTMVETMRLLITMLVMMAMSPNPNLSQLVRTATTPADRAGVSMITGKITARAPVE